MPLSIRRGSTFAWITPSVQLLQPHLGQIVRSDAQDRRDDVQHLADILADLVELTLAAWAGDRLRLKHLLAARQCIAPPPPISS
jgi:hypothetical protein